MVGNPVKITHVAHELHSGKPWPWLAQQDKISPTNLWFLSSCRAKLSEPIVWGPPGPHGSRSQPSARSCMAFGTTND